MLLLLNLPLVGPVVSVLKSPAKVLMLIVAALCLTGVYAVNSSAVDLWTMVVAGVVGYLLRARGYDLAPLVLAIVLGPKVEIYFRESLFMSAGSFSIFATRPIALVILLVPVAILGIRILFSLRSKMLRPECQVKHPHP